ARCRKAPPRRLYRGYLARPGAGARPHPRHSPRGGYNAEAARLSRRRRASGRTMREIVLDTETTGLDPLRGDRLVEIGCVAMAHHMPTGQVFHCSLNPERDMPQEAFAVHGLSTEFLADKPLFSAVVDEFLAFIGEAPLVIHNAAFDVGFIN